MGIGAMTRGTYSLQTATTMTGYSRTHLLRASAALNQKWKRMGPRGTFLISHEQIEDIVNWLRHDFWCKSKRLYNCVWCTTSTREHRSGGLCGPCFFNHRRMCRRLGLPPTVGAQLRLLVSLDCKTPSEAEWSEKAAQRLRRKVVLDISQLDWLAMLRSGAE